MKRFLIATSITGALLVFAVGVTAQVGAEVALRAAIEKETVKGDLTGAIDQYKKLAQGKDRAVAARALMRMGECYEKLGDAEAQKAYERVVQEFEDQRDSVDAARVRLTALGKSASGPTTRLVARDVIVFGPSADGHLLLQQGAEGALDLRDLRTGQIRPIAKACCDAAASPDGRQVAFTRCPKGTCELRIVGADGTGERLLSTDASLMKSSIEQWFPDGKRIMVRIPLGEDRIRLAAVSTTDGAFTTLAEVNQPRFLNLSSDGKNVVYTRRVRENPAADELWLLRLEDRSEVRLSGAQFSVVCPLWTPDGTGVVYLSDRRAPGTTMDLWLLRIFGGTVLGFPELIKSGLGEMVNGNPTIYAAGPITRDGAYYFYRAPLTQNDGMRQLLTTKFEPDRGKAVGSSSFASPNGADSFSPSFSQDGSSLAYIRRTSGASASLVIQSAESGAERVVPIAPSSLQLNWAVMFPDGRSLLVFFSKRPGNDNEVYKVDAASGALTSLKKPGEGELNGFPSGIAPDGRTLYLSRWTTGPDGRSRHHVISRDLETGQERELSEDEEGTVALSFDGKQLAMIHTDGKDLVIEVMAASGGPKREIHRVPGFGRGEITWMPDGRHLIFAPRDINGNAKSYFRIPVDGGDALPVGLSASPDGQVQFPLSFGALVVHPNGRQLVFTGRGGNGGNSGHEDWVLENFLPKTVK